MAAISNSRRAGAVPPSGVADASELCAAALREGALAAAARLLARVGLAGAAGDRLLVQRAVLALRSGQAGLGLALARRAAARLPNNAAAHSLLARAWAGVGHIERAGASGARALELDPLRGPPDGAAAMPTGETDGSETDGSGTDWDETVGDEAPAPSAGLRRRGTIDPVPIGPGARDGVIDIIVPVHSGFAATSDCLRSVLAARTALAAELVLVDDGSPDPGLARHLARLARRPGVRLLRNAETQGFVRSVNRALATRPGRDVVVLNADTLVPDMWLERLVAHAIGAPDIATVTPLTNNGQHVSVPEPFRAAACPTTDELAEADRAAQRANAGCSAEIPCAAGFCMWIRRDCLNDVGAFDAGAFGAGYGEETDFSFRASRRGWRHVCATDLYVAHRGGVSFGARKARLVAANTRVLKARYPVEHARMAAFSAADPLREARGAWVRALVPRPATELLIAGPVGGELEERALRRLGWEASGGRQLWLRPLVAAREPAVRLEGMLADGAGSVDYALPREADRLLADLGRMGVREVALLTVDLPGPVLRFAARLGRPLRLLVADGATLRADSQPGAAGDLLGRVRSVHVGTAFAAQRMQRAFSGRVARTDVPPSRAVRRPAGPHLAVVHGPERADGLRRLHELVPRLLEGASERRIFVFGNTFDDGASARRGPLIVLGEVTADERRDLVHALGCGTALSIAEADDPLGLGTDIAVETCPRLLVDAGAAARERTGGHPAVRYLPQEPGAPMAQAARVGAV